MGLTVETVFAFLSGKSGIQPVRVAAETMDHLTEEYGLSPGSLTPGGLVWRTRMGGKPNGVAAFYLLTSASASVGSVTFYDGGSAPVTGQVVLDLDGNFEMRTKEGAVWSLVWGAPQPKT